MRQVIWSPAALDDLADVLDYYATVDEPYALRPIDEFEATGNTLGRSLTGRPGRIPGTFEKSLPRRRYILLYEVAPGDNGAVNIVHVVHTARSFPPAEWSD